MFTYQVRYFPCNELYLSGLRHSLNTLSKNNPDWQYRMQPYLPGNARESDLILVDATNTQQPHDFSPEVLSMLYSRRTLVLVNAAQRELTATLITAFSCSVLCVDEPHYQLRDIIQGTLKKTRYLSPFTARVLQRQSSPFDSIIFTLAERRVLEHLRRGYSGVEIARLLFRSQKTVSSHKRNIMRKLGVKNDVELSRNIHDVSSVLSQT